MTVQFIRGSLTQEEAIPDRFSSAQPLKNLPGQGTEHDSCSALSLEGNSPHNAPSTCLDVPEGEASCTTHVRLRTWNPSPHFPLYEREKKYMLLM